MTRINFRGVLESGVGVVDLLSGKRKQAVSN